MWYNGESEVHYTCVREVIMKTKLVKKLMTVAFVACMGLSIVGCSGKGKETDTRTTYEVLKDLNISEYLK